MKKHVFVSALISAVLMILVSPVACSSPASPTKSDSVLPTTPVEVKPTPPAAQPQPTPTEKKMKISDPANDVFNAASKLIDAESYMDIIEAELNIIQGTIIAAIKVKGLLPGAIDAPKVVEYDVLIDFDRNPGTGWNNPMLFGDIGVDGYIHGFITGNKWAARITDIKNNQSKNIDYKVENNTIELRIPETLVSNTNFNYVFAVRKYAKMGDGSTLVTADKCPDNGHLSYPEAK